MGRIVKSKPGPGKVESAEEEPLPEITEESVGSFSDSVGGTISPFLPLYFVSSFP